MSGMLQASEISERRERNLPLTRSQEFVASRIVSFSDEWFPISVQVEGAINPSSLEDALREVISRHEALRTTFYVEGETVVQKINHATRMRVPTVDVCLFPFNERAWRARDTATSLLNRKNFSAESCPLLEFVFCLVCSDVLIAYGRLHRLVADYTSVSIILRDWFELYDANLRNAAASLPPVVSFVDYICGKPAERRASRLVTIPDVPSKRHPSLGFSEASKSCSWWLSSGAWRHLHADSVGLQADVQDLILARVGRAMGTVLGASRLTLMEDEASRPPEMRSTAGNYSLPRTKDILSKYEGAPDGTEGNSMPHVELEIRLGEVFDPRGQNSDLFQISRPEIVLDGATFQGSQIRITMERYAGALKIRGEVGCKSAICHLFDELMTILDVEMRQV